jgi:hypothetical protein
MSKRFSERIGKKDPKTAIQVESMDSDLRNSLWNVLEVHIFISFKAEAGDLVLLSKFKTLFLAIWFHFLKEPIDQMPIGKYPLVAELYKRFFSWDYLEVYDFIDFLVQRIYNSADNILLVDNQDKLIEFVNLILERESSGYRVIKGQLAAITNESEISSIEQAIDSAEINNFKGANIHLSTALNKYSDRQNPDYRNSIKESISAIESICKEITHDSKADLVATFRTLKKSLLIHPALEQGFLKLYGYTSDSDGIRHALMDEPNLYQEDALFMLVAASAFVNYLIAKAAKGGQD